jgi:hypothetical protein
MGKILTGNDLKFIATHREQIEKYGGGIYFCFDSVANGEEAYEILSNALMNEGIRRIRYGWDKRDFTIYFNDGESKMEELYPKILKEVQDYRNAHPEATDPYYTDPNDPDLRPSSGNGSGNGTGKSASWTNYLIIGAAAVAVVLLLWDRKKK